MVKATPSKAQRRRAHRNALLEVARAGSIGSSKSVSSSCTKKKNHKISKMASGQELANELADASDLELDGPGGLSGCLCV